MPGTYTYTYPSEAARNVRMTLDEILQHINTYLEDGSPAEALERLDELLEEINDTVREPLKCDVARESKVPRD